MIPILYEYNETKYATNGIGRLADIIKATVTENRTTGDYELELTYPMNGIWADKIAYNTAIMCPARDGEDPQIFDVHEILDNSDGTIEVLARHVKHRLYGIPVKNYSAAGSLAAIQAIETNALIPTGFVLESRLSNTATYTLKIPSDAGHVLRGMEGSLLDFYGGEYQYDNFHVILMPRRGADNGVTVRYGKNLKRLSVETTGVAYTGVYAYWTKEVNNTLQLVRMTEPVYAVDDPWKPFIQTLDLSSEFENAPTVAQLTAKARTYLGNGEPEVSYEVEYEPLYQMKEFGLLKDLERVTMGDTIRIIDPSMNVDVKARVYETEYDPVTERMKNVKVGNFRPTIIDTIVRMDRG